MSRKELAYKALAILEPIIERRRSMNASWRRKKDQGVKKWEQQLIELFEEALNE